ncbi:hypothetical protein AAVH_11061 [Aphelenchoides avenae]|nr:hypothetical protein AAVH_11061 [Aphelenchus avenae]
MSFLNVPLTYGSPEYALPRSRSVANVKDILPAPAPTSYQHGPLTRCYSVPDLVGADVRRVRNPYKPQWSSYYITNYPYRYYPEYSLTDYYGYPRYNPYLSPLQYSPLPPIRRYYYSYDYPFYQHKQKNYRSACNTFYEYLYKPHGWYRPSIFTKYRRFYPYQSYLSDKWQPRYWLDNYSY